MKVKDLVEHLLKLNQELEVYSAADSGGNYYNRVHFEPDVFLTPNDTSYRIEEVFNKDDVEDCGYDEDDLVEIVVI